MRRVVLATIWSCAILGAAGSLASAQSQRGPSRADEPDGSKHLLIDPYLTSTGATVDKPGVPQGSAPTALDRKIRRQDNKIDNSICRGCGK